MRTQIYAGRFVPLGRVGDSMVTYYDVETKVMYLTYTYAGHASICVMVDENGKPLLYKEK